MMLCLLDPEHVIRAASLWNFSKPESLGVGFGNWVSDGLLHSGLQNDAQCKRLTASSLNVWVDMVRVLSKKPKVICLVLQVLLGCSIQI